MNSQIIRDLRTKIGDAEFRSLSSRNDLKAATYFCSRIAGLSIAFMASYFFWSEGQLVLCIFAIAMFGVQLRFMGWAGFAHELFHGTVFSHARLNRRMFVLFSSLNLSNYGFFDVFHPIHHRSTLKTDHDFEGYASKIPLTNNFLDKLFQFTFNAPRFFKDLTVLVKNATGRIDLGQRYIVPLTAKQKKTITNGARGTIMLSVAYFLLIWLLTDFIFSAVVVSSPYVFTWKNDRLAKLQHEDGKWDSDNIFESANTLVPGPLTRWLYANMNYHVEHHLIPNVPFYNLPLIHDHLVPDYLESSNRT